MTDTDNSNYIIYQKPLDIIVKHISYHLAPWGQRVTNFFLVLTSHIKYAAMLRSQCN